MGELIMECSFLVTRTSLLIIDNMTTADTIIVIMVFYCLATRQPVELQMEDNEYPPLGKGKTGYYSCYELKEETVTAGG